MEQRRAAHEEVNEARYTPFGGLPDDRYEVLSVVRDDNGTAVSLVGERHSAKILFGFVEALFICDEGRRIESYNRIGDIQPYRRGDFFGNPLFRVSGSDFMKRLEFESCGFSFQDEHYAVITRNDFIDIASAFPPKIEIS